MTDGGRLRGWKSIAAYLGVTQSTAMRWARDPDFPALRSGSGGTVYASAGDLDGWLARRQTSPEATAVPDAPPAPAIPAGESRPPAPRRRGLWLAGGIIALITVGATILWRPSARPAVVPPPAAARMLADARQEWAERTPAGLARSIAGFQAVVLRYPDLPDGFTGLADSYLLACEYAAMPRGPAFARARAAVTTALALAPADPDAHRIRGFLTYWTTRDIARAAPDFEIAVAAEGYLAHLWYGNALVDAGRVSAGLRQLDRALAIAPDSAAVLTDQAIATWQTGDRAGSLRRLAEVERRFPQHSSAPGWSALFHLSEGDAADYLRESARWATLVGDPAQAQRLARERAAYARGGAGAMLRSIAYGPTLTSAYWHGGLMSAAIAASLLGDRDRLIVLLRDPRTPKQDWRPLPFPAAAFRRWRDDPVVALLLTRAFGAPATVLWPS